jgi:hypothetical protein
MRISTLEDGIRHLLIGATANPVEGIRVPSRHGSNESESFQRGESLQRNRSL